MRLIDADVLIANIFINMVEMMRKECDKSFYYNPILSSVN